MDISKFKTEKVHTFPKYRCISLQKNIERSSFRRSMSFFDSDVVRAEMTEIQELQEEVYSSVFKFPSMNTEEKKFHVSLLERLLDKQKVLYTRLSLSDDPEAKMMKTRIVESATMMGLPKDVDISVIFSNMGKMLDAMKKQIDTQGFDV